MKHIQKNSSPVIFQQWVDDNNEQLQEKPTGEAIWDSLHKNKNAKESLQVSLLEEQGYICAYCGTRIGKKEGETLSVEHFKPKSSFKELTLAYSNLFGCCKISQENSKEKSVAFPIAENPNLTALGEIAEWLDIDIENIKTYTYLPRKYNKNTDLSFENSRKPEAHKITNLTFKANIHHCDDTKGSEPKSIISPTDADCERYFQYEKVKYKTGRVGCEIYIPNEGGIIKDTIEILNLNATNLCKDRLNAFREGTTTGQQHFDAGYDALTVEEIILNDIYKKKEDNKDGKLKFDAFCFVKASIIRSYFE